MRGYGYVSRHNKGKRRRRPKSTAPQVPPRPPRSAVGRIDARPKAPWHPFPLIELCVLIGIVCIVVGVLARDSPAGRTVLGLGVALGALGGLDTAFREHWAGYRSHTLVLAAAVGVPIFGVLLIATDDPIALCGAVAAAAFAGSAWFLARAFRRRSGGALFRLRG
jgi:hypothetical protein